MTPEDRRKLLASNGLARLTAHTITSERELEAQVEAAARDGYAFSVEELEQGLNAVAAPVRDHTGGVIAALSVSGPVYRFTEERMREATPDVVAAAAAISHRMGHLD
jgi:DNA-binding IclR family transcriptional regulator